MTIFTTAKDSQGHHVSITINCTSNESSLELINIINDLNFCVWRDYKNDDDLAASPYDYFEIINEMSTNSKLEQLYAGVELETETTEKKVTRATPVIEGVQVYYLNECDEHHDVVWASGDSWEFIVQIIEQVFETTPDAALTSIKMCCTMTQRELSREYS